MAGNSIGNIFRLSTFGESHGIAIGGVIDGCPSGVLFDVDVIQQELNRRRPNQSKITTSRDEKDKIEILSGVFNGKTLGTPIGFIVRNENQKSEDYDHLIENYRPSHADYTYDAKYGIRDYRGSGRTSARETIARVVGGAVARMVLNDLGVEIKAYVSQVGEIKLSKSYKELDLSVTEKNIIRCPDAKIAEQMIECVEKIKKEGDTIGGVISCVISGVPVGLGEPVYDKLQADLAKAMLSINAVKGFEYGSGFDGVTLKGSEHNDRFENIEGKIRTVSNHSGGIQGGISNGEDIYFNVAFKAVSTIMQKQITVNSKGEEVELEGKGRHDPCVLPRAVPIVEAMAAMTIVDHYLRNKMYKK